MQNISGEDLLERHTCGTNFASLAINSRLCFINKGQITAGLVSYRGIWRHRDYDNNRHHPARF